MAAGIPGTGMATLFYIVSALLMPLIEAVNLARGRSSRARWKMIARHFVIALAMAVAVYGTFRYLPAALLGSNLSIGVPAVAVTVGLFLAYLVLANLVAALTPGQVTLPQPKQFPERRMQNRPNDPAPAFHPGRRP